MAGRMQLFRCNRVPIMSNNPNNGIFFRGMSDLLAGAQTVLMATSDSDGLPEISYSPFVISDGGLYVFISDLSVHTGNLKQNPRASLLFIEDEHQADNLHARRRATFAVTAQRRDRGHTEFAPVLAAMQNRFGEIIQLLTELPDFHLFRLTPSSVTVVLGFAQAQTLSCSEFPAPVS